MKDFIKKNYAVILTILLLCGVMFYYNTKKEGFHEDEMYSYGASNYRYDNVFRPYGYATANNDYLFQNVLTGNLWTRTTRFIDFLIHQNDYQEKFNPELKKEIPIWKTKEEAKEYMTVEKSDILNFASIWYNQLCDVHPPMFYNALHIFSIFFLNNFSKYIGFLLNITFFIITIIAIYQIMKILGKEKLGIPSMILYGGSIGAISTVAFQRMYMMLTCFSTIYLYYALKFLKQNKTSKKDKILWVLTIFMGFMTQYYFCIYIVLIFFLLSVILLKNKKRKEWLSLFLIHLIPALLGILVFPSCIEDIFFSYRGLGATQEHTKTFLEAFFYYLKGIKNAFSIPLFIIIGIIFWLLFFLYKKKIKKQNYTPILLCLLPIPLFLLIISKIAPFLGEAYTTRYMMLLYPSISIIIMLLLNFLINHKQSAAILIIFSITLSIYGYTTQKPTYLYERYDEVLQIAKEHHEKPFIYIFDNYFTHLSSMPEFMTYDQSLIINYKNYNFESLKKDTYLNQNDEIIICIKNWLNVDELLKQVQKNTEFKNAKLLLEIKEDIESSYFILSK